MLRKLQTHLLLAFAIAGTLSSAPAAAGPPVTTTVSDVAGVPLSALPGAPAGKAMVAYTVTQQADQPLPAGTVLPSATVARSEHQDAYRGLWAGSGFLAGWVAPKVGFAGGFEPEADLVESIRFRNRLKTDGGEIPAGSRVPFGMAQLSYDSPAPWDRAPSAAPGVLGYETATHLRTITARSGGTSSTADVGFFRVDLVARGGDVDARGGLTFGPAVVDFGRPIPNAAASYASVAVTLSGYIMGFNAIMYPHAGKMVLYANVSGVIREAREYTLPTGVTVNEWHLPIVGAFVAGPTDDLMTAGVEAGVATGVMERAIRLAPPGARPPAGIAARPLSSPDLRSGITPDPLPEHVREMLDASRVDASIENPVDLRLGNGSWSVRLDPDHRGQGVLGVTAVRRMAGSDVLADSLAVPFVDTDAGPIRLDRSRLRDLRVTPFMPSGRWYWFAAGAANVTAHGFGRILDHHAQWPALQIEALYDLGNGLEAHLMFTARTPMPQPELSRALSVAAIVRSASGDRPAARPVQHLELPAGAVTYDGAPRTHEFSAPVDLVGSHRLTVGGLSVAPSYARSNHEARVTVLRGPAALSPAPGPDPSRALDGDRVTLVVTAPPNLPSQSTIALPAVDGGYAPWVAAATSLGWVDLPGFELPRDVVALGFVRLEAPVERRTPAPKPLGTPCGVPQVTDLPLDDADAAHDLKEGWLDSDEATVYATMRVRQVPTAAAAGQSYAYVFMWRHEHIGYYARAAVDDAGRWSYEFGRAQSFNFVTYGPAPGEVRTGPDGLIRVAVPRELFDVPDGHLLRFTSAWAQAVTGETASTRDRAPETSTSRGYGDGGDYTLGRC